MISTWVGVAADETVLVAVLKSACGTDGGLVGSRNVKGDAVGVAALGVPPDAVSEWLTSADIERDKRAVVLRETLAVSVLWVIDEVPECDTERVSECVLLSLSLQIG